MSILLAALLALQTVPAPVPEQLRPVVFRCHTRIPLGSGAVTVDKTFSEDGSVHGLRIEVEDRAPDFVVPGAPSGSATARLTWPGEHRVRLRPEPFSWTDGSIRIDYNDHASNRYRFGNRERWRQFVVDRRRALPVYAHEGARVLLYQGLGPALMSELIPLTSGVGLRMSLDDLLAWGSGVERLTVYDTIVQHRRFEPNVYPNTPAGPRRIVGEYGIIVASLRSKADEVQRLVQQWEATLTDVRTTCEREAEEAPSIIVT